jgi:Holliday junction resolvase RusA-like endonuclease
MAEMISFTVPGIPIAQPRPRACAFVRGGKVRTRIYRDDDSPIHAWRQAVTLAARMKYQGPPLEGPVGVKMDFFLARPKSMQWKKRPMLRCWHDSRPDLDNFVKGVLDALNGILWEDDGQVVQMKAQKQIAAGGEQPCVEVMVWRM